MKSYYRIMLGKQSLYAKEAREGNYIGVGWLPDVDLTNKLPDNWREFNKEYIPIYLDKNPSKTKIAAGLACGMLHTITKGIVVGDIILSPDGQGNYFVGEITGGYEYHKDSDLPHRRGIHWYQRVISRDELSESLRNSA